MYSSLDGHRWREAARAALEAKQDKMWMRLMGLGLALLLALSGFVMSDGHRAPQTAVSTESVVPAAMADLEAELGESVHLPMDVNERVEFWMRRYLANPTAFSDILARAGLYSEMIRGKLRERGMPQELIYLAAIESEYSTKARSPVAATGMWQFMGPTAKAYGLQVDAYVDERRDPIRATEAALDYLNVLYERYDSWYLAAAAYNAGPTRVSRALRRHAGGRTGDEELYWDIIDHLPRETADFVPKLLAATTLAKNAERYGLDFEPAQPVDFELVWVPGLTRLSSVASGIEVPERTLRALNPHLVQGVTPPGTLFGLRVPVGGASVAVASLSPNGRWSAAVRTDDD